MARLNDELWHELEDFAKKASGDIKTKVAACLIWPDGRRVFGANRLRDSHGLTPQEITERIRPRFHDAMKCGEADAIDKAIQLGLDLGDAKLYTLMFPCPRCAEMIVKTNLKYVAALTHRTKHNGKFDSPLEDSRNLFDKFHIEYETGEPDER